MKLSPSHSGVATTPPLLLASASTGAENDARPPSPPPPLTLAPPLRYSSGSTVRRVSVYLRGSDSESNSLSFSRESSEASDAPFEVG